MQGIGRCFFKIDQLDVWKDSPRFIMLNNAVAGEVRR